MRSLPHTRSPGPRGFSLSLSNTCAQQLCARSRRRPRSSVPGRGASSASAVLLLRAGGQKALARVAADRLCRGGERGTWEQDFSAGKRQESSAVHATRATAHHCPPRLRPTPRASSAAPVRGPPLLPFPARHTPYAALPCRTALFQPYLYDQPPTALTGGSRPYSSSSSAASALSSGSSPSTSPPARSRPPASTAPSCTRNRSPGRAWLRTWHMTGTELLASWLSRPTLAVLLWRPPRGAHCSHSCPPAARGAHPRPPRPAPRRSSPALPRPPPTAAGKEGGRDGV
jgi:hypothetical protein